MYLKRGKQVNRNQVQFKPTTKNKLHGAVGQELSVQYGVGHEDPKYFIKLGTPVK